MEPVLPDGLATSEPDLLRTSARVSVVTGIARVVGFGRFIALALAVGTTYLGNTYETANWVPNIVFELAAGGVLSAVFVPTFVRALEHGRERGMEIASSLANTFLLLTIPVVIVGALAAHPIMRLLTIGVNDPAIRAQQIETGAWFLYVFLPQVPLYVFAMVMTGVLHANRRFMAPAAAPLWSSLVVIGAYITFGVLGAGAELGEVTFAQRAVLGFGTTAGVFVLAFSQLPSVLRLGVRWRPVLGWRDPDVRRALRAGGAGIGYFAGSEVLLILTLLLANRVQGGVVAYRVAFAFFELPKAMIGLPIAAVLLPSLARRFARKDDAGYARELSQGWRAALFVAAPAAAGLAVLAPTLARALLSHAPSGAAPELVGSALRVLALGVPAFVLVEPLIRSFFARHEAKSPVLMNTVTVGAFAALVFPLTFVLDAHGARALEIIGLSNAVGQWLGVGVGVWILASRVPAWNVKDDLRSGLWSMVRGAVMGAAVYGLVRFVDSSDEIATVLGVVAGLAVYMLLSLGTGELQRTMRWLRERNA